jgi:hypothetical protein
MTMTYEVRLRGRLTANLLSQFEHFGLVADGEPVETLLHGPVADQAALYGLLRRIEALGLELVELRQIPTPTPTPTPAPPEAGG